MGEFEIVDFYFFMCYLFGIDLCFNNGFLIKVRSMLKIEVYSNEGRFLIFFYNLMYFVLILLFMVIRM